MLLGQIFKTLKRVFSPKLKDSWIVWGSYLVNGRKATRPTRMANYNPPSKENGEDGTDY